MASSMVWDDSVWWIGTAGTMCFLDMTFDAFYGHRWWNVRRRDLVVLEGFDVVSACQQSVVVALLKFWLVSQRSSFGRDR